MVFLHCLHYLLGSPEVLALRNERVRLLDDGIDLLLRLPSFVLERVEKVGVALLASQYSADKALANPELGCDLFMGGLLDLVLANYHSRLFGI